ncbi:hypothetical protein FNV43_RR05784 [Rhamnella rubrinervis]|uniref:Uncharacterized protein n=1 Tax=Rhamnella rubrinervis TaxID=2594499 RepID=A0A8K0HMQ6_9ROSA|nr:hypothetical protein FNV43_RR05784 [Rhamnella rubrinervis]
MASFDSAWEMPIKATKVSNCLPRMDNPATVYGLGFEKSQAAKLLISGGFKLGILASSHSHGSCLKFDHSTIAGNYDHYDRVLVDEYLNGFVLEKLLLETTNDYIEVDLYFESFLDFCISSHSVGHSMAKYKSVIEKAPLKVRSHDKEKENKAPGLTQVYKPKQVPPSIPTTNVFEVLNTNVTPTHLEDMVHHLDTIPSGMADINTEMGIEVRPPTPDLVDAPSRIDLNTEVGKSVRIISKSVRTPLHYRHITSWADTFGDSEDELDNYVDNRVEEEWSPLQGKGSSKPSKEFDGIPP